jgi:hypothetical protein
VLFEVGDDRGWDADDAAARLDRPGEAQPCRPGLPGQRAVVLLASPDAACVHVVDPDAGQSGAERSLAALVA